MGGKGDKQGIMQEIEVIPYHQMPKPESVHENKTHNIFWDFEIQILTRRPDLVIIYKK